MITKEEISAHMYTQYGIGWRTNPDALAEIESEIHNPENPQEVREMLQELVGNF